MTSPRCRKISGSCTRRPTDETPLSRPRTAAVLLIPLTPTAGGYYRLMTDQADNETTIPIRPERFGLTLIGFASRERFNVYAHPERVVNE